jgi:hypothetical protein
MIRIIELLKTFVCYYWTTKVNNFNWISNALSATERAAEHLTLGQGSLYTNNGGEWQSYKKY